MRVEPLDDADVESFFGPDDPVDLSFAVKFVERLVVVPRGGDSGAVTIGVVGEVSAGRRSGRAPGSGDRLRAGADARARRADAGRAR